MGHIKPELIQDLATELKSIRAFAELKEKKPGVFYFKSIPFMHFHDKEGRRWAHVKCVDGAWLEVNVAFSASKAEKAQFLKSVQKAHRELFESKVKKK